jgi:hypothetical protein
VRTAARTSPVQALVRISLADLMRLDGSPALAQEWIAEARARWAAARAAAPETGSDGGAYPGRDPPGRDRAGPALPVPRQMLPPNRAS